VTVPAITCNGQVPGPLIRVTEGDAVRVTITNELPEDTAIHWHGLHVPNAMDGVPPLTQAPIKPGESFTYEFTASHAGTFMYHSHQNAVEQIDRGLYGPIIISNPAHPMHLHGGDFTVVAKDGEPIRPELQQTINTLSIDAGEIYDIVFRADNPGTGVFHCHELHHMENDGVEPGGLIQFIQYEGCTLPTAGQGPAVPTAMRENMPEMQH
jgi:FtsP/CotA-like multicopper oxidase with cupredoxin domain